MSFSESVRRWFARRESIAATSPARLVTSVPREDPITRPPPEAPIAKRQPVLQPFAGPLGILPAGQAGLVRALGDPGIGRETVDLAWERANLIVATGLRGRWNGGKGRLYVHRRVEPYVREALLRCEALGVLDYIQRFGCFNFRHQRHDAKRPLSRHAWAAAVDVNSDHNGGWYIKDPPLPWSPAWVAHYPHGVPELLVRAFESCGWTWGGRWHSYCDPQHFQIGK